jgi:flagellar assembly factor FliW
MQIETRRFGTITVADDEQFDVPEGIPGFRAMRHVALLGAGAEQIMYWIQDLDDGALGFLCVVPWDLFPEYDIEIDENQLGIDDNGDVRILNLITVHKDPEAMRITANLRAPLVVDVRRRQVRQVILADSRWTVSEPVAPAQTAGAK